MRTFILLCGLLTAFYLSGAQPVIQNFAPRTAPAGTAITILGTGFSTIPANNIVYFGPVKATVSTATGTTLTVIAPAGASFHPISVTVDSLTGFSAHSFSLSFPEAIPVMSGSFEEKLDIPSPGYPYQTVAKDFDGDGKTDLAVVNSEGTFSIYRNSSTPHQPSFHPRINFAISPVNPSIECADIDGDGKIDVLITGFNGHTNFEVHRNTSTPGNISFAPKVTVPAGTQINWLTLTDVNGDGKTDVVATNQSIPGSFSAYKNLSSPGSIIFSTRKIIPTAPNKYIAKMAARDLDSDGKPELLMIATNSIMVYKNSSTLDTMIFAQALSFFAPEQINIQLADFNRDGKMDIASSTRSSIMIFQNSSVGSSISFTTALTVPVPNIFSEIIWGLQVADYDGDEWPDIAFMPESVSPYGLYMMSNQSDGTNIQFGNFVKFFTGFNANRYDLTAVDVDNDSKPDLITTNNNVSTLSLYLNKGNQPIITAILPSAGTAGTLVSIKGFNFNNSSAVRFGNASPASFTLVSDTLITATAPVSGQTGLITITNPYGDGSKNGFTYDVPVITTVTPTIAQVGDTLTIYGNNFAGGLTANIVKIGASSCPVIQATSNQLRVVIPHGTTRQPLTVTTNGLTGYYDKVILLPFDEAGPLASNSFAAALSPATAAGSGKIFIADLNEDGKPDLLSANYNSLSYTLLRNTSTTNNLSFAPKVDITVNTNSIAAVADDMNGDGKPDLVLADNFRINVLKNSSTPGGAFNFSSGSTSMYFDPSPYRPNDICTGDFNRDGRPDIALTAGNARVVSIFKNKSLNGNLAFHEKQDYSSSMTVWGLVPADINNDGSTDLVVFNTDNGVHRMLFMKNTTAAGGDQFSFDSTEIVLDAYAHKITMADIDGDGYKDLCIAYTALNKFTVYRNLSSGNTVAFAPGVSFNTDVYPRDVYADDLDGDGIVDIVCANETNKTLWVFKGLSVPGTINFAPRISYQMTTYPLDLFVADLDADGKPDIAYGSNSTAVTIVKNKVGMADLLTLCPGGSVSVASNLSGSNYKWHQRIGTQFIPIDDNTNYAGTNSNILQLNNLPSSFAGNEYSCRVDGNYSNITKLSFRNSWTGAINGNWEEAGNWSCGSVPDMYTDVVISSGAVIINSNVTIRSLSLASPATITVTTGNTLTILH